MVFHDINWLVSELYGDSVEDCILFNDTDTIKAIYHIDMPEQDLKYLALRTFTY